MLRILSLPSFIIPSIRDMSNQSEAAPSSSASSAIVSKSNMTLALVPVQKQLQTYIVVKCMSWLYQMEHMKLAQVQQEMF